ncbi:hypothetical protein KAX02_10320 [candidate division WOR-3 bacterium]|nr:hypothetical protein [candidate division WOR-3 bacterium]
MAVIVRWRNIVFFNIITITLIAVIVSLVVPQRYTSTGKLFPPLLTGQNIGISQFTAMLSGFGLPTGIGATPSDLFAALLKSRSVIDSVIEEHGLKKYYEAKIMLETRETLLNSTDISVSPEGIITISVTDRDPEMASKIVNSYIKSLDAINKETSMTVGKRNRIFLEERIKEINAKLKSSEDSLKEFQERHHIISLPDELTQAVTVLSTLLAQKINKEIELGMIRMFATEENPQVLRKKKELSLIEEQINDIGYDANLDEFGVGFSIPLQNVPETCLKLARFMRSVEVKQKVFIVLTEQYEHAKIQELRDTPTVEILDIPEPPEKRSFPKRKRIVAAAFVLSLFVGIGLAFFFDYTERIKDTEEGGKWNEIANDLNKGIFKK